MKKFKMQHRVMKKTVKEFYEDNPPKWMLSDEFKWWYDDYVLKLEVGKSIRTDFQNITRIE